MALVKCPECGKEISDRASACPNCGYPLAKERNNPIGAHSASKKGSAEDNADTVQHAHSGETNRTREVEPSKVPSNRKVILILAAIAACVVVLVGMLAFKSMVRYKGLPNHVANQVGYVASFSDGPKVTIAVHVDAVNKGDEAAVMWDLDQTYIVGMALFSKPVIKDYHGDVEITGIVSSCDGVDELDLSDATIVG